MEKEKIVVVVCVIYFAAMILIGIIAARRNKATSDYLVGMGDFWYNIGNVNELNT